MKRHVKHQVLVALSASVLLPISVPAWASESAESPDTSNWVCKLCPVSNGWFGEWNFGLNYVGDPTSKFADYRGLIDDGTYLEAGGDSSYRSDTGLYFDFNGRNLGLDSRALDMRVGKQGAYEFHANYNEVPRYQGHGTLTPYAGVGTDVLMLADNSEMTPARLKSKRKTVAAGLSIKMGSAWKFQAGVEQQSRDGTRAFSGGLFAINGAIFPAPIDYTTTIFNTALAYTGNRGQLRLEWMSSDFDNRYSAVTWENPMAIGFGDDVSRSALAPDNEFYQASIIGAYHFSPRFRISGKASIGNAKQNAAFLPYSINPAHEDLVLPRDSLDGKIDTSIYNLFGRAYIRLADRLDLTAQYKYNERDNRTPVDIYSPILLEMFTSTPRSNRPYGYKREQGKVELRYRPRYDMRLNAGMKRDSLERTYQDVLKTDEDAYFGEIHITTWAWLGARLKLDRLNRDAEPFEEQGNYDRAENPLMRKFNMAERERDRVTVEFDLTPADRFDIALSYYTTDDNYTASVLGLTDSEETSYNLDLNYSMNEHVNLYAFINKDNIESNLSGANGVTATPWNAATSDEILTWGLGISGQLNDKIEYGVDYVYSNSDGDILTDSGAGEDPFPVLKTKLRNARVYLGYQVNERWGLGMDAYREQYDSTDWQVDGVGPLDINGILTMGEISPDYDVYVVRLFATVSF